MAATGAETNHLRPLAPEDGWLWSAVDKIFDLWDYMLRRICCEASCYVPEKVSMGMGQNSAALMMLFSRLPRFFHR